jgi:hypothetical protein
MINLVYLQLHSQVTSFSLQVIQLKTLLTRLLQLMYLPCTCRVHSALHSSIAADVDCSSVTATGLSRVGGFGIRRPSGVEGGM